MLTEDVSYEQEAVDKHLASPDLAGHITALVEALSAADQQSVLDAARTFNGGELRAFQSQVYLETAQEAEKPTPLRDAIRRLEGADGLQRNLVTLALADELGSNEDLHAATSGGGVVSYTPLRIATGYRDAVLDVGHSLVLPVRGATLQAIQAPADPFGARSIERWRPFSTDSRAAVGSSSRSRKQLRMCGYDYTSRRGTASAEPGKAKPKRARAYPR